MSPIEYYPTEILASTFTGLLMASAPGTWGAIIGTVAEIALVRFFANATALSGVPGLLLGRCFIILGGAFLLGTVFKNNTKHTREEALYGLIWSSLVVVAMRLVHFHNRSYFFPIR